MSLPLPSESLSADITLLRKRGKMLPERQLETPRDEIGLVFGPAVKSQVWIDPQLSAVYVIGNDANSLLKIGYADNLKHRFSGMDCGSPVALNLLHFVYFVGKLVSKTVEKQVHSLLDDHRRKGEWFDITLAEATAAIAAVTNERRLVWWTEVERRKLGTAAFQADASYHFRDNFYLRH